jgi:hypothetical protein
MSGEQHQQHYRKVLNRYRHRDSVYSLSLGSYLFYSTDRSSFYMETTSRFQQLQEAQQLEIQKKRVPEPQKSTPPSPLTPNQQQQYQPPLTISLSEYTYNVSFTEKYKPKIKKNLSIRDACPFFVSVRSNETTSSSPTTPIESAYNADAHKRPYPRKVYRPRNEFTNHFGENFDDQVMDHQSEVFFEDHHDGEQNDNYVHSEEHNNSNHYHDYNSFNEEEEQQHQQQYINNDGNNYNKKSSYYENSNTSNNSYNTSYNYKRGSNTTNYRRGNNYDRGNYRGRSSRGRGDRGQQRFRGRYYVPYKQNHVLQDPNNYDTNDLSNPTSSVTYQRFIPSNRHNNYNNGPQQHNYNNQSSRGGYNSSQNNQYNHQNDSHRNNNYRSNDNNSQKNDRSTLRYNENYYRRTYQQNMVQYYDGDNSINEKLNRSRWNVHPYIMIVVLSNGKVAKFDTGTGRLSAPFTNPLKGDSRLKNVFIGALYGSLVATLAFNVGEQYNSRSLAKSVVRVYNVNTGIVVKELIHSNVALVSMCTIPSLGYIVCGTESLDEPLAIWEPRYSLTCFYPSILLEYGDLGDNFLPHHIQHSRTSKLLFMASYNSNKVFICDETCTDYVATIDCDGSSQRDKLKDLPLLVGIFSLHICDQNNYVFVGMRNGIIKQYDLLNFKYCQTILCHNQSANVRELAYDYSNSTLYAVQHDYSKPAWDLPKMPDAVEIEEFKDKSLISAFQMIDYINWKIRSRRTYVENDSITCSRLLVRPTYARYKRINKYFGNLLNMCDNEIYSDITFAFE